MSKKPEAKKIFNKWKTEFRGMNKKREAIPSNFDQLFYAFNVNSVEFDIAEAYISDAVGVHLPDHGISKRTFKFSKNREFYTFEDFVKSWKEDIEGLARESFYRWYDIDTNEQDAPKKVGGMEPQAYMKYKKYINSFPVIDPKSIEESVVANEDEELDFGDLDD